MTRVAIASQSETPAIAGAAIADAGGNAVDAALAAVFASWVCEPGYTALGSGAFMTVWSPEQGATPICLDGFAEVPGRQAASMENAGGQLIKMPYGVGVETGVGAAAVATPGALLAAETLWQRWGKLPWEVLFEPAIDLAQTGFVLSESVHAYYEAGAHLIFSQTPDAARICMKADGTIHSVGTNITMPDLAASFELIAAEGAKAFYRGDLGHQIGAWMKDNGGLLSAADLAAYEVGIRPCHQTRSGNWMLATAPLPAIGGETLKHLVVELNKSTQHGFDSENVNFFACAMKEIFSRRNAMLYGTSPSDTGLSEGEQPISESSSTSHVSSVDSDGLAVSITSSCGYSAGVIVPQTGILLNNMLGEQELNADASKLTPGTRIMSNMSPVVAHGDDGSVISLGAAGSQRIVSAIARVWMARVLDPNPDAAGIDEAVEAARCHMRMRDDGPLLVYEPGVDVSQFEGETEAFDSHHMYFGCVQAAQLSANGQLTAKADPRRAGGVALGGA
ncbi:MAG: gamma-glutamyltransferase [Phycisphaerales bacterium]|nr:gamma-glutamyltransferase [Phycisphaerales bacterium]